MSRIPLPSPACAGVVGGSLAAFGIGSGFLFGSGGTVSFFSCGGFLVPFGTGLMVLGAHAYRTRQAERQSEAAKIGRLAECLREILCDSSTRHTVESIARKSGVSDDDVVPALRRLRDTEVITEELDLSTGDWYYVLAQSEDLPLSAGIDERMRALERKQSR